MNNTNLFLDERYNCNDNVYRKKINCQHWSVNNETCALHCSLKNINPTSENCFLCKERTSITIGGNPIPLKPKSVTKNIPPTTPTFAQKAMSYAKAEMSQMFSGKVSNEVYEKRKAICLSCDYKTNPSPDTESIGWCKGGCGCKVGNPRAALSQKLYMPALKCPLKKFGQEKGEGFNIADAVDSVKGAATAINETLKPNNEEK